MLTCMRYTTNRKKFFCLVAFFSQNSTFLIIFVFRYLDDRVKWQQNASPALWTQQGGIIF